MLSSFSCASWPSACLLWRNVYLGLLPIFFLKVCISCKIYFILWLCWVFASVRGLSLAAASGGHSSSQCVGLPTIAASPVAEHRLQTRRLSNYGSRAQPLRGMWDLPRPGPEPASPALAGRLSTTAPPGKPPAHFLIGLFVFLILSCMSCLYILEINPLSIYSFTNIFSHSEGCLFVLFVVSFALQKLLSFIRSHLFILFLFPLL